MMLDVWCRFRAVAYALLLAAAAFVSTPACSDGPESSDADVAMEDGAIPSEDAESDTLFLDAASEDTSVEIFDDAGADASAENDSTPFSMTIEPQSYAGAANSDPDSYVAVIIGENNSVLAYACDSKTRGQWFFGSPVASPSLLRGKDYTGTELFLSFDIQDDNVIGSISTGPNDETPLTFSIPKVDSRPVLYRGSYAVTGQGLLGGWIVLPDGSQRGLLVESKDGEPTTVTAPTLDTSGDPNIASTTSCDATLIKGVPLGLSLSTCTSSGCVSSGSAQQFQFNVVTFGDSFAAGEGAPEQDAINCEPDNNGSAIGCQTDAVWTNGDPDSRFCHRSPFSGSALAIEKLRAEFPQVRINFKSFACTGAKIENIFTIGQTSPLVFDYVWLNEQAPGNKAWPVDAGGLPVPITTQAFQLRAFLDENRCGVSTSPDCWASFDALVMGIGGNDAFFAKILEKAMKCNDSSCTNVCGALDGESSCTAISRLLDYALNGAPPLNEDVGFQLPLSEKFADLKSDLDAFRFGNCTYSLPPASSRHLVELPLLGTKANGTFCSENDFVAMNDDIEAIGFCQGDEPYLTDINTVEVELFDNLEPGSLSQRVRTLFKDAAESAGWRFVTGILERSKGHGICEKSASRYFNTNCESNRIQGNDMMAPEAMRGLWGDDLSMGIAHPNRAGYAGMYRDPIADALREKIRAKFAPIAPAQLVVTGLTKSLSGTGPTTVTTLSATVSWLDKSSTESKFKLTPSGPLNSMAEVVIDRLDGSTTGPVTATITLKHPLGTGSVDLKVQACSAINVCVDGPTIKVSGDLPQQSPTSLVMTTTSTGGRLLTWVRTSAPQESYWFQEVTVRDTTNVLKPVVKTRISVDRLALFSNISSTLFATFPTKGTFTVRACNFTGCGPESNAVSFTR